MSGELTTQLDMPYNQQPETRAAARSYLERTGNADLIEMLGLGDQGPTEPGYVAVAGKLRCSHCGQKVRADGVCRHGGCGGRA